MNEKEQANTDYTYCYGMNCKKAIDCWRYTGHYKFNNNYFYSFVPGKVENWECIEEE